MREQELIVYREFEDGDLLYDMAWLMSHYNDEFYNAADLRALFYDCIHKLIELQYTRNDMDFKRSTFRVHGDVLEVFPSENIQGIKTETIGMMARHLIAMSIKKRDNLWQLDM